MTDSHNYEFDKLKLYFGEPLDIDGTKLLQPTIGDILEIGEKNFYQTLYIFTQNPTSCRLELWDMGIDWNKISEFELFSMLITQIDPSVLHLFLPDFNLYKLTIGDNESIVLYDKEHEVVIDENIYHIVAEYLRTVFNIHPKVELAKGKTTKQWIIEEERTKREIDKKENNTKSNLIPLVSTYLNHPGTKYKKSDLKNVHIYEFMDALQRIQIYESTVALNHGIYSGMVDVKSINDKNAFNFMRDY